MPRIILFGGGDGGGLIFTENGVKPLPPFDPYVIAELRAVSQLVKAEAGRDVSPGQSEVGQIATQLASVAIDHVEAIFGELDPEGSLVVLNEDHSGFVCGTDGKPPQFLQRPPRALPPAVALLGRGGMDRSLLEFVRKASDDGRSLNEVVDRPLELAEELGIELSERTARDLKALSPEGLSQVKDPVAQEVISFFRKVLEDGRFVDSWAIRPASVARKLKVDLSDQAIDRVVAVGSTRPGGMGGEAGIIWIVVAIVVGVIVIADEGEAEFQDFSGIEKF